MTRNKLLVILFDSMPDDEIEQIANALGKTIDFETDAESETDDEVNPPSDEDKVAYLSGKTKHDLTTLAKQYNIPLNHKVGKQSKKKNKAELVGDLVGVLPNEYFLQQGVVGTGMKRKLTPTQKKLREKLVKYLLDMFTTGKGCLCGGAVKVKRQRRKTKLESTKSRNTNNKWLDHVKKVQKANPNLEFKDVLKKASRTWKNGAEPSSGKKKPNKWLEHVKKVQKANPSLPYKQVLKLASASWH